jgi:HTH-type transcriptional regulator / antitoxin PezA
MGILYPESFDCQAIFLLKIKYFSILFYEQLKLTKGNMDSVFENTGSRIKNVRKLLNITQDDFAEKLNIALASLSNYENGKQPPPFEIFIDMATKFNVNLEYIVLGKGEPFNRKGSDFDIVFEDNAFGEVTEDIRKMFLKFKRSNWLISIILGSFKQFLFDNKKKLEKEIKENEQKKEEK